MAENIVIIEINVVVKRIEAAICSFFLNASAIKIVETADGVPAWRTTADVSLWSKFKITPLANFFYNKFLRKETQSLVSSSQVDL